MKIHTLHHRHHTPGKLTWQFPLPRTHTGVLMGNGTMGLMIWGEHSLNITVGRAGFWDHRGGRPVGSPLTYSTLRELLEAGDEQGIRDIFDAHNPGDNKSQRTKQIGGGSLHLKFGNGFTPDHAELSHRKGNLTIYLSDQQNQQACIHIRVHPEKEQAVIDIPPILREAMTLELIPSWQYIQKILASNGFEPPIENSNENSGYFIQPTPADQALTMGWRLNEGDLRLGTALGVDAESSLKQLKTEFDQVTVEDVHNAADAWWQNYKSASPKLTLPDPVLQAIWDYGLYKQALVTPPQGIACSLQGPFLEEYQLPPWQCDYHFNINIQMIYAPCLSTNHADHFDPLWQMIHQWWPSLTKTAKEFFEVDNAIMLPHAVDDLCQAVGAFWTGTIDHACTAWMALLAWRHYRYTLDHALLEKTAWPMLTGAFEGYWAMLEEHETPYTTHGKDGMPAQWSLSLPVSVSPEYNGSLMNAWGRNASFQLAACHMLVEILTQAATLLGKEPDPRWARVSEGLPPYTLVGPASGMDHPQIAQASHLRQDAPTVHQHGEESRRGWRIGLWEGKDLDASHRHHSHIAGVWPFDTIDIHAEEHVQIIKDSLHQWAKMGMGAWSGWSIAWAAGMYARVDCSDAAVATLRTWFDLFVNTGGGTLHDPDVMGISTLVPAGLTMADSDQADNREVMQLDAGFGALEAVSLLLVQTRGLGKDQIIHVLPSVPNTWRDFSFENIRAEGAFMISAEAAAGALKQISVHSEKGGLLRMANPWERCVDNNGHPHKEKTIEIETEPGQILRFVPA